MGTINIILSLPAFSAARSRGTLPSDSQLPVRGSGQRKTAVNYVLTLIGDSHGVESDIGRGVDFSSWTCHEKGHG